MNASPTQKKARPGDLYGGAPEGYAGIFWDDLHLVHADLPMADTAIVKFFKLGDKVLKYPADSKIKKFWAYISVNTEITETN